MPVFNTPADLLARAVQSVRAQTYANWELCIADDASAPPIQAQLLALAGGGPWTRVMRLPRNTGIAAATNAALSLARGDFVALLDHDDELAPHALARVATEIAAHPGAEMVFSDEDKIVGGRRCCPYFKPGWNPDLMLAQNAVNHLGAYSRARLVELGGLREGFDGSQDYDLALRFAAACGPAGIRHIPEVLYHWRQGDGSFSTVQAARARQAAFRAVAGVLPTGATVQPDAMLPQWARVTYPLPTPAPLVSIITAPQNASPGDADYPAIEVLHGRPPDAVPRASGAVLVFLAPSLVSVHRAWLRELVSQALRPEVGAAGGRLDRPDGRIAQSGLVLDPKNIAATLRPRSDHDDPGYFGQFRLPRTVSAVSGDFLAIRRTLFLEMAGFDPACGLYADVDLCLRLAVRGLRCVWTPHARLRYTTPPRNPRDARAAGLMRARWGEALARDPYFNPNLAVRHGNLALRRPRTNA